MPTGRDHNVAVAKVGAYDSKHIDTDCFEGDA